MEKPFRELRERLLRAGVAPRHVRRYLAELAGHLSDLTAEEERAGRSRLEAQAAALARLGAPDDLAAAMIGQRQFQSWSARAPWAAFGLLPLCLLAAAYFVACLILWSGWKIFLPAASSPFGAGSGNSIFALQNLYFQTGKSIYFGAPLFIGWGIALIAARQRARAIWPSLGFVLIALLGGTAQIDANLKIAHGPGHISLSFLGLGPSPQPLSSNLVHVLLALALITLPYLAWRLLKTRFTPA